MNRTEFYEYITEEFNLSGEACRLVDNILQYVEMQGISEDEQYHMLSILLDGIGLSDAEIRRVYL